MSLMFTETGEIDWNEVMDMEEESLTKDRMIALEDDREKQEEIEMIEEAIALAIEQDDPDGYQALVLFNPEFVTCEIPSQAEIDEF